MPLQEKRVPQRAVQQENGRQGGMLPVLWGSGERKRGTKACTKMALPRGRLWYDIVLGTGISQCFSLLSGSACHACLKASVLFFASRPESIPKNP